MTTKISNSYPLLELSTLAGLPHGVLLTASDCLCCAKHNGHCSTAWNKIKERYSNRQTLVLMLVLQQIHKRESYDFPELILQVLQNAKGDDDAVAYLDSWIQQDDNQYSTEFATDGPTIDIYVFDINK